MSIRPTLIALVALAAVLLAGGLGAGAAGSRARDGSTIFSVAALGMQLQRHPAALLNRTLVVRGAAFGRCADTAIGTDGPCATWSLVLVDATPGIDTELPVSRQSPPTLMSALRRWPLLMPVLPAPQPLVYGSPAVYRVQVRRAPCTAHTTPCYEIVLIDTAP